MSKAELDNLVRIGKLKLEPASRVEFDGMVSSARTRLVDAQNEGLDPPIANSTWPWCCTQACARDVAPTGYRSEDRISVFQTLVHTVGTDKADIQIFLRAHNERNLSEYEGRTDVNPQLLTDLIRCTKTLQAAVAKLDPPARE